ncbi:DUF3152 domain-containing protein [Streptomyces sp. NPDC047829]|uniref:DUF3152 domain-containing protein n=1 Tax=Streptomyces sp. NPDC047829 TaxID=3154609 RepID=UPI0033C3B267
MGRHSRRGPAPKADDADTTAAAREGRPGLLGRRRAPGPQAGDQSPPASGAPGVPARGAPGGAARGEGRGGPGEYPGPGRWLPEGMPGPSGRQFPDGAPGRGRPMDSSDTPAHGMPRMPDGTPAHGIPRMPDGTPARGVPRFDDGTPGRGVPRFADGTPGGGLPRVPDGTPAHGFPRVTDGTPAHGVPRFGGGAPAHGGPRAADGTPAHGVPRVRGGHPEQRESGGGWGEPDVRGRAGAGYATPAGPPPSGAAARPGAPFPRQRQGPPGGPRQEYLDAFGERDDVFTARPPRRTPVPAQPFDPRPSDPYSTVTDWSADDGSGSGDGGAASGSASDADDAAPTGDPAPVKGGKGRTFTGIAAAAVTTVLAVVVAGQVADGADGDDVRSQASTDQARDVHDSASRADGRPTPSTPEATVPLTYAQKMGKTYPLGATLKGSGRFDAIPGIAKGPGKGEKYTYRVDVEQGLGLDGELFAEAVHKTLNDDRSWAHDGARSFERIHSGQPNFVITLASPGTTADWCAKSGLDTTQDNVSCDSAATERVMINAYRWAQGAEPFGDAIHAYRQMLINHEVGHRIGFNHVSCDKDGELAPVMQQQTKFVDHDGIDCRPNAWAYPNS